MANIEKFSFNMGTATFDFDSKKVILERSGSLSGSMHLTNMTINFSDITEVELRAPKMLKVPAFCFIVNGKRLVTDVNINATQFTLNKSDYSRAQATLQRLVQVCNLSGIKEFESSKYPQEVYKPEISEENKGDSNVPKKPPVKLKDREFRKRCNVCGTIFCYTMKDITKGITSGFTMAFSGLGAVANAAGGSAYNAYELNKMGDRSKAQVMDLNHCPNCHSTDLKELTDEEFEKIKQEQKAPATNSASVADELKKFKELLDMGAITQEEFDAKKKQLLGL